MPHPTTRARRWPRLRLITLLALVLGLGALGRAASAQTPLGPEEAVSPGRSGEPIRALAPADGPAAQVAPLSYPPDPTGDIDWTVGLGGVADIQAAFNGARSAENAQLGLSLPALTLPSQAEWDALSVGERALWLINRERQARGVDPLYGVEANVTDVAQTYAQYLLEHNVFSHNADGRSPWERMEDNPAIGACHDFLSVGENIAVFVTSGSWIPLPVERSVYMWMYEDAGQGWGHRHTILWTPYTDNSGPSGREGFLGIGLASGGPYQGPFSQPWNHAALVVMNVFDPCASWDYGAAPAPNVTGIAPAYGVNTGALHAELSGSGFQAGAPVRLSRTGQADIAASDVVVVSGERITCNLNLAGAAPGAWDVVVTNPDAQTGALWGGLTVTLPSEPGEGAAYVPLVLRVQGAAVPVQRLVVFEGFFRLGCGNCQTAAATVENTLAPEFAGQPVLWLEYDVDVNYAREWVWWTAYGGSSAYLPMSQVDSGQQIASGYEDFATRYRSMVNTALARPAGALLAATGQRLGDGLRLSVQMTNRSGATLNNANDATLWVIVYEEYAGPGEGRLTSRVARHNEAWEIASLAPDATATYTLDTASLSGVNWDNVRAVVLADYRPGGASGPYDMLQAARVSLSP